MMLNIFSCACYHLLCLLWKNICSVLNLYVHLHREGAGSLQSKQLLVMALGQGNGSRGKGEEEDSSDTLYSYILLDYSQ